jgi:NADH-quinone oxidoreductase subunit N
MSLLLKLYSPEGFLIISCISLLVFNSTFTYNIKFKFPILNFEIFHQILTLIVITLLLLTNMSIISVGFDFFFISTIATQNLKLLLILIFFLFFIIIWRSFIFQKLNFFEYFIILLIILVGLFFLISSYNLISIYLGLEIQALGFYILASFNRNSIFSSESGLKYFISSSLISGIFLLGSALIYGTLGTINLYQIEFLILNFFEYPTNFSFSFFFFGIFLILNALLFKLVIAPFHFWFPQIYDGAPLSSTIVFSILPKIALVNLFIQIWSSIFILVPFLELILFLIGIYSMIFGIFKMLKQKKLKKLYIYSSISNMGLLLCILIDNTIHSIISIYFFLIIYILMSFILWTILVFINYNQNKKNVLNYPIYLNYFSNLLKQNHIFGISICFVFFSLAAIPPFVGFLSKIYLYFILIKNYKYEISILLIYLGTFGTYFYIKFLKIILFENLNNKQIQNFYPMLYFNIDSTLYSISLFLLIFFAIEPNFLFYFCYLLFY